LEVAKIQVSASDINLKGAKASKRDMHLGSGTIPVLARYYPGTCPKTLRKNTITSVNIASFWADNYTWELRDSKYMYQDTRP